VTAFNGAITILTELAERQGRAELADDLAMAYLSKGAVVQARGDLATAVGLFDRALAILSHLVSPLTKLAMNSTGLLC
jgi:hypothetical protein